MGMDVIVGLFIMLALGNLVVILILINKMAELTNVIKQNSRVLDSNNINMKKITKILEGVYSKIKSPINFN